MLCCASFLVFLYNALVSFVYTRAKALLFNGGLDLDTDDIRVVLLRQKAFTTCDDEPDVEFMADFTTLGEITATNYSRIPLTSRVVDIDYVNRRAELLADDILYTALGGAMNDIIGAILIYKRVTSDLDSIPIAYIDNNGSDFGLITIGSDIPLTWSATGILQEV